MTDPDDDLDPALGAMLRRALRQRVDPETSARHMAIIKSEAARLQAERGARRIRVRRHLLIAALIGLLLMSMSGGAVAASGAALPGDLLYPVKLGTEQVRLLIARSPEADSAVRLDIARRRITEAQQAVNQRPESVNGLVQKAMVALDAANTERDPALRRTASDLKDQASRTVAQTDDLDPVQADDALQTPSPRTTPGSRGPGVAESPSASPSGTSSGSPKRTDEPKRRPSASPTAPPETSTARSASPSPSPRESATPRPTSSHNLRPETSNAGS